MSHPLVVLALLLAAQGAPPSGNPYVQAASELYATQRFPEAREQLKVALQVPGIADEELERALDLLARCHVAEGRRADAERAYDRLLSADPHWEPEAAVSPKIREAFDAAKRGRFRRDHLELRVSSRTAEAVTVELVDPWARVATLAVLRGRPGAPDAEEPLPRARFVTLALRAPGASEDAPWEVVARSDSGEQLARLLSDPAAERTTTPVPSPAPAPAQARPGAEVVDLPAASPDAAPRAASPRLQRWPAWLLTGVAVVSLSVATALQLQAQDTAAKARASLWAGETRALDERARTEASVAVGLFALGGAAGAGAAVAFLW